MFDFLLCFFACNLTKILDTRYGYYVRLSPIQVSVLKLPNQVFSKMSMLTVNYSLENLDRPPNYCCQKLSFFGWDL